MWKSLFLLGCLSETVSGYLLSKSDPICREESFLFFWKSMNPELKQGISPFDITNDCCVLFQTWFQIILVCISFMWIFQFVPVVINFIEGPERRTKCCDEKKKKKQKSGKGDKLKRTI